MVEQTVSDASSFNDRQLLGWIFTFLRPVWRLAALAGLFLALWIGAEILTVRQTAEAVNRIKLAPSGTHDVPSEFRRWLTGDSAQATALVQAVAILACFYLATSLLTFLREVTNARFSMGQVFHIREAVYDKVQRIGMPFHDRTTTGEVINRALSDLQKVRQFIQSSVLVTLEILLIVGGYLVLLAFRCPWAVPLAVLPLPLWIAYTIRFSRKVRPAQVAETEIGDRSVSILTENIAGVHVVKAFATQQQEIAKYGENCDEYLARVLRRIRLYANFTPVVRGISMVSHLSLFLLAGYLIIHRVLLPGDVLVLGSAMGAILGRLQQVAAINEQYQGAIVSARRLHEVLSAAPAVPQRRDAIDLPPGRGAVWFENVSFGYVPDRPVLRGVSFDVPAGATVAVVGPTGAGKTTLVQLLARFYDPQSGRITVDGVDVRDVALDDLRRQIAYVFQETYLFSHTVAANVAYGRPEQLGDDVTAAARLAQADDFVQALPRGYDTLLGERGATLSGGQRQRLAIARALLTDPRILILDDATAAVDPETEELIHAGLDAARRDRTVFVIAHRLHTVRRADVVIVLEGGRVTQKGTHTELVQTEGYYRSVARTQLLDERHLTEDGEHPAHVRRVQDGRAIQEARAAAVESMMGNTGPRE